MLQKYRYENDLLNSIRKNSKKDIKMISRTRISVLGEKISDDEK